MWVAVLAGVAVLAALVVFFVQPLGVLGLLERLTPQMMYCVKTEQRQVGLSFDDGPNPNFTPQVLEILEKHKAKATFFLISERARRSPELVGRIRAAGHEIGNHYIRDGSLLGHSEVEFLLNLEETEKTLGIAAGAKLFRPPGGVARPRQLRLARERGYQCVLGCAYPHDPMHPPVWYIEWLIKKNLRAGTIVILHDGISDASRSVRALPGILEAGQRKGLRFVSIGELMKDAQ